MGSTKADRENARSRSAPARGSDPRRWPGHAAPGELAGTARARWPRSCDERLQVRPHHPLHAADPGVAIELVHREATLAPRLAQCLQRDVETDLVAVLEQVGQGLRHSIDLDPRSLNPVLLP